MKKSDVRIGAVYEIRVSGKPSRVRLDAIQPVGGKWTGTDLDTGRTVHGKNTNGLRKPLGIAPTAVGSLTTTVADVHRQWQALKASNPGTILLFRVGDDRFEAYGDDATVCCEVLGLELTSRFESDWPTVTVGPYVEFLATDLEANIRRLVSSGHRVAVCERVLPGEGRKPIEKIVMGLDGKRVTVRRATASDACSPFDDVV